MIGNQANMFSPKPGELSTCYLLRYAIFRQQTNEYVCIREFKPAILFANLYLKVVGKPTQINIS